MKLCLAVLLYLTLLGASAATAHPAAKPIATVVRHGGLCITGMQCRAVFRITDTTISADGYRPRRLLRTERTALLRAIRALDLRSVRAHPFTGTCPTAYDGTESIYRFRGVTPQLASCKYALDRVRAVTLTDRLLSTLR